MSGEIAVTLAVEQAMGLIAPLRATWLRTLLAELARIHSHLSYLSYLADEELAARLWRAVDQVRDHLRDWSGNRVHPMLTRIGGLASPPPAGWLSATARLVAGFFPILDDLETSLARRAASLSGLGVADQSTCRGFGLSGPVSRAAGLNLDRRLRGYLAYPQLEVRPPTRSGGDAHDRFAVLLADVRQSCRLIEECLQGLPEGPVEVALSRRLKVPEGEHHSEIEAPWGIAGVLLVSRGGPTPWRLALRTPTFANVSALNRLLKGTELDLIPDVVASLGYAIGDLDK
ncbi:MAG: NADH-quinone oxidoreductase subunit D [Arachnia sp.]